MIRRAKEGSTTTGSGRTGLGGWAPFAGLEAQMPQRTAQGLSEHQVQVQHGPGRQAALGNEQQTIEALDMKGRELGQPDLPESGEGIALDEGLVALVPGPSN